MTDREQMYNIIVDADNEYLSNNPRAMDSERFERIADALISAGVLMPPCKIGQTVYRVAKHRGVYQVLPREVVSMIYYLDYFGTASWNVFTTVEDRLGKTVFLTKEEAEAAIEEKMQEMCDCV